MLTAYTKGRFKTTLLYCLIITLVRMKIKTLSHQLHVNSMCF
jgi:hypothetical protein